MPKIKIASQVNVCSLNGTQINLRFLEGGSAIADVIKNSGPDFTGTKHVANISYEDFVFETGLNDEITRVIKATWNDGTFYSDGSFITANADFKAIYEDEFQRALLTETIIPPCDASSKEVAVFRLRLQPESVHNKTGNGADIRPGIKQETKTILKSNFRFELGKLPCTRVVAIDSFSVKISASEEKPGIFREPTKHLSIDFPNLFLTISSADLAPWFEYYKSSLIDGNHLESDKLTGMLTFLSPNLKVGLFSISLQGVGILSLQRHLGPANDSSRFRVGLYCDRMIIE